MSRKSKSRPYGERSNCPKDCPCLCHDMGGGPVHLGRQCKTLTHAEKVGA